MSRFHRLTYLLSPLLSLFLIACAGSPAIPDDHYYRLTTIKPPNDRGTPAFAGLLKVDTIKSYGIYRERALLYTQADHPELLQQHRYHYWIDTPSRLIHDQLVAFLRTSGIADGITGSQLPVTSDLHLKLTLKAFERVLHPTGPDRVRVALDAVITHTNGKPIKHLSYRRETKASEASIPASVNAINRALHEIYLEIVEDLRTLIINPASL
jgi:ABC-type uncharacterized transport system auxiliary subunit